MWTQFEIDFQQPSISPTHGRIIWTAVLGFWDKRKYFLFSFIFFKTSASIAKIKAQQG